MQWINAMPTVGLPPSASVEAKQAEWLSNGNNLSWSNMEIKNVTVVGGGAMGNGIAHVFAQYGYLVTLNDVKQEFIDRAVRTISSNLDRQVKNSGVFSLLEH